MTLQASATDIDDLTFLGRQSERLSDLIADQTAELFEREGIRIPVKSCSLIETLSKCAPASASDLAARLGRSHQIVMQKLPKLVKLGLVERTPDPADGRRFLLRVTADGEEQLKRLDALSPKIASAYRAIEAEVGPVFTQINAAIGQLERNRLAQRID